MLRLLYKFKCGLLALLKVALIIAVALLVLDVLWGVFTRHIMQEQAKWTEELARFLLIWISLLGGAVAFESKGHLGVDFFVGKFHPDTQHLMALVSHAIVLLFAIGVFVIGGSQVVLGALRYEQVTPALGWKMGYVYLALPIAGVFMSILSIEHLVELLRDPQGVTSPTSEKETE